MTEKICKKCNNTGWKIVKKKQQEVAQKCDCQIMNIFLAKGERANIPHRFLGSEFGEFSGFQPDPSNPSQQKAKKAAEKLILDYPAVQKGLLYQGSIGLGKTHLLCTIGFELIKKKNVNVYYIDWNDLVREMRTGEDHSSRDFSSINQTIRKLTSVELLIFDELGGSKVSPWVHDNIYYLFNKRYNENKITLCATNFSDHPQDGQESLSQRIGERIRSRLYEMTSIIELAGSDFRRKTLRGN